MIRVPNQDCIRSLSRKSLAASRTRNIIAILAIALTTMMFTALFTVAMSIGDAFEEANFRQVGGYSHGEFKYLTREQCQELQSDPLIQEYGIRRFLGMPTEAPFHNSHVEISYCDANVARWMYCDPAEGRLPAEDTMEAAADTTVLSLLELEPEIGREFTVTFTVDGVETTQSFILSGWWESDGASPANHILLPESRVNAILEELDITPPGSDGMTGVWNLDVMFRSSAKIWENMMKVLDRHGYQGESPRSGDNYISVGVNWGYINSQLADNMDSALPLSIAALLLLMIATGYLIIYNVFRISVAGDIRFFGLLKAIGATGRQLKSIIRTQAMLLSLAGIPAGCLFGWLLGGRLAPRVLAELDHVMTDTLSVSPWIFVFSALFSLFTVQLSYKRPGRLAAGISPMEAVRYTESNPVVGRRSKKMGARRGISGVSLPRMAAANMGRSRGKTAITLLSLALALVVLNTTVLLAGGFDMDKYLSDYSASDFIVANTAYFRYTPFTERTALSEEVIEDISGQTGIINAGKIYGEHSDVVGFFSEENYRQFLGRWEDEAVLDMFLQFRERDTDNNVSDFVTLYGMEPEILRRLTVLSGDIDKLCDANGHYIAVAMHPGEDYSQWFKPGDTVKLRYIEKYKFFNPETGMDYPSVDAIGDGDFFVLRAAVYEDIEYEIAALVYIPLSLSYRYVSSVEFVLNDQTFIRDTGTSDVMLYAFDTTDETAADMEAYLADYTTAINPTCGYESKASYQAEFESFRNMFLLLGGVMSFIMGLVGILNFVNATLTGILSRRREFAMLQSIGMTGIQLKRMLICEGLFYTLGAVLAALLFSLVLEPVAGQVFGGLFTFFTYRLTLTPILFTAPFFTVIGCTAPLLVYRVVSRQTIVERLRDSEN